MRFLVSLIEQGLGSVLTFGVNLWLIRNGEAASYGVYVFWYAIAWMLGTLQGTLAITHLFALPSERDHPAARRQPERFLLSVMLALVLAAAVAVAVGNLILGSAGSSLAQGSAVLFIPAFLLFQYVRAFAFSRQRPRLAAAVAVAAGNAVLDAAGSSLAQGSAVLFIPAFLLFQYVRAFAFSRQRPRLAAALSAAVLAVTAAGLAFDAALGDAPTAGRVMFIVGLAYGLPAIAVLLILLQGMSPMLDAAGLRRQVPVLRGSGWLLLGAGSGEVTSRLYSFAVVGRFGTEALAALSAVQVVIRPAWMLSAAWISVGFPAMSGRWKAGDTGAVVRTMARGVALTTGASLAWSAVVVLAWPWISGTLYGGRYTEVGWLAYLWGANVVLGSIAAVLNTGMLSIGEFRRLALLDMAGALVVIVATAVVLARFSYGAAVVATLLGQATQIALMAGVLRQRLRVPAVAA